jgi:hypothetical protein
MPGRWPQQMKHLLGFEGLFTSCLGYIVFINPCDTVNYCLDPHSSSSANHLYLSHRRKSIVAAYSHPLLLFVCLPQPCRLRDALEPRGYLVDSYIWDHAAAMSEAEIVRQNNGEDSFPAELDWDVFQRFYRSKERWITLRNPQDENPEITEPLFAADCPISQSVRTMSGSIVAEDDRESIDVVWLSPTVFVSSFMFGPWTGPGHPLLTDYLIRFTKDGVESSLFAYSFPAFVAHLDGQPREC